MWKRKQYSSAFCTFYFVSEFYKLFSLNYISIISALTTQEIPMVIWELCARNRTKTKCVFLVIKSQYHHNDHDIEAGNNDIRRDNIYQLHVVHQALGTVCTP